MRQVIVNLFSGASPICLNFDDNSIITNLKIILEHYVGVPTSSQRITTEGGKQTYDKQSLFQFYDDQMPPIFNLLLRIPGGKGGFGHLLRATGSRITSRRASNNSECRDLNGRRIKQIEQAKKVAEYLEQKDELLKEKNAKVSKKVQDGLRTPTKKKARFDEITLLREHDEALGRVEEAVSKAFSSSEVVINNNGKRSSEWITTAWEVESDDDVLYDENKKLDLSIASH